MRRRPSTAEPSVRPEEEAEPRDLGEFVWWVQDRSRISAIPWRRHNEVPTQVGYPGRKLADSEGIGVCLGMHIGGLETTQYAISAEGEILARRLQP